MLDLTRSRDIHIDRRLRTEPIIWLSTVRPDGRPHLVPVWFLWDGMAILIFSQPATQKIRNLRHNPHAMLALEAADRGEDVVLIEGRAALLDDPAVTPALPPFAEKYLDLLAYIGSDLSSMVANYTQAIRVTPVRFR